MSEIFDLYHCCFPCCVREKSVERALAVDLNTERSRVDRVSCTAVPIPAKRF